MNVISVLMNMNYQMHERQQYTITVNGLVTNSTDWLFSFSFSVYLTVVFPQKKQWKAGEVTQSSFGSVCEFVYQTKPHQSVF